MSERASLAHIHATRLSDLTAGLAEMVKAGRFNKAKRDDSTVGCDQAAGAAHNAVKREGEAMSDEISKEAREAAGVLMESGLAYPVRFEYRNERLEEIAKHFHQAILTATAPLHSRIKELEEANANLIGSCADEAKAFADQYNSLKQSADQLAEVLEKHRCLCFTNLHDKVELCERCIALSTYHTQHPPTQEQEKKG